MGWIVNVEKNTLKAPDVEAARAAANLTEWDEHGITDSGEFFFDDDAMEHIGAWISENREQLAQAGVVGDVGFVNSENVQDTWGYRFVAGTCVDLKLQMAWTEVN